MADFSNCSLDELIEVMTTWPVGVPVRTMERPLALGEAAIPALSDVLRRWQTKDSRDLLWPIVLFGELRSPGAIPPLVDRVRRTEEEELALAAAEGLVKIGAASLPRSASLQRIAFPSFASMAKPPSDGWITTRRLPFCSTLFAAIRSCATSSLKPCAIRGKKRRLRRFTTPTKNVRRGSESNSKMPCATCTPSPLGRLCGQKTGKRDIAGSRFGVVSSSLGPESQ